MKNNRQNRAFLYSAKYYNIFYKNKKYKEEAKCLDGVISKILPKQKLTMLDLGCGTGKHIIEFSKRGYNLTGVDRSVQMLNEAKKDIKQNNIYCPLVLSDIGMLKLKKQFDVVVSLFHVLSYQTTNKDVCSFFSSAARHVRRGGLLIFDCWYGPGVLIDKPKTKIRKYKNDGLLINRNQIPTISSHDNVVSVTHKLRLVSGSKTINRSEIHRLRYFFHPEIIFYLESFGFNLIRWGELEKNLKKPGDNAWSVCYIAIKN